MSNNTLPSKHVKCQASHNPNHALLGVSCHSLGSITMINLYQIQQAFRLIYHFRYDNHLYGTRV